MTDHHALLILWDDAGTGRTTDELRADFIKAFGTKALKHWSVLFRRLMDNNLIERQGTKWTPTAQGLQLRPKQPEAQKQMKSDRAATLPSDAIDTACVSPVAENLQDAVSNCNLLRRIIAYYIDCVRMEERPTSTLYADAYNQKFISLPISGRWWAESADEEVPVRLPYVPTQSDFLRNVARNEGEDLFVGYPLYIFNDHPERSTLVVPIFCIPATAELDDDALLLSLGFADADINADWLQKQFRTNEERRAFLRQCGLADPIQDEDAIIHESFLRLPAAAQSVMNFCGTRLADGTLNLSRLHPIGNYDDASTGIHNTAILYAGKRTHFNTGLLKELRAILAKATDRDLLNSSLRHLFKLAPSPPQPDIADDMRPVPFLQFNHEQEQAISHALNNDLTVITGPPGTGKSQVAANIISNIAMRGKSALFASKNHKPIDAVVPRTNALVEGEFVIYRANDRETGESFTWRDAIRQLLAQPPATARADEFRSLMEQVDHLLRRRAQWVEAAEQWTQTERDLGRLNEEWETKTDLLDSAAVEYIRHGAFPAIQALRSLNACISFHPRPQLPIWLKLPKSIWWRLWHWPRIKAMLPELQDTMQQCKLRLPDAAPQPEFLDALLEAVETLKGYIALTEIHTSIAALQQRAKTLSPLEDIRAELDEILASINAKTSRLLAASLSQRSSRLTPDDRQRLAQMRGVLNNLTGPHIGGRTRLNWERFFAQQLDKLLTFFPLWAVTNLSVRRCLPLAPGVIDTVIIDEASQCDIASVIPLLYRARRAVIIGDPNQLRPVHTLQSSRNHLLLGKHRLLDPNCLQYDFLQNSCYELASYAANPVQLQDHFRSHTEIIDYCNAAFYGKTLRVETALSNFRLPRGLNPGICWHDVSGNAEPAPSGTFCKAEIEVVGTLLTELLLKHKFEGTVGIVTPFKEHAKRIYDWTISNIDMKLLERARFVSSTAEAFQGDERDVIICSMVLQPDMPRGARWYVVDESNRNLWNVAISRARALLHVVGNLDMCRTCEAKHLRELALRASPPIQPGPEACFESPWEKKFYEALLAQDIQAVPQYSLAGKRLDLAIPEVKLDIEVDGERYHRDEQGRRKAEDLWRDVAIKAAGWIPLRFWVYELREDIGRCVEIVTKHVHTMKRQC